MSHHINTPFLGRLGWVWHRILASYWSLPVLAVVTALPIAVGTILWDRDGLTAAIIDAGLEPVATSDTAKDLVGVATGINAAFITLYFSLTLLVLTVASSNLGVRLVDRWLDKRLVRVSLSGLAFTLVYSLTVMAAIDGEAPLDVTPLGSIAAVIGFQALNVAMLAVALHDLGRTIFVDRSIHHLGREAAHGPAAITSAADETIAWANTYFAPREGYIEGNDLHRLAKCIGDGDARVRVCAAPGSHVLQGQPILQFEGAMPSGNAAHRIIPIGNFRSDGQGAVFRIRLLVEIAARALSPAINDFYTAIACADRLTAAMEGQFDCWVDDGMIAAFADDPRIQLPGQDFRGLFQDPLAALRQAACQYPSVSIRLINNYGKLIARAQASGLSPQLAEFLARCARDLAEHAASRATYDGDARDIRAALSAIDADDDNTRGG